MLRRAHSLLELIGPLVAHLGEGPEHGAKRWFLPQPQHQPGQDLVLDGLRLTGQRHAGLASLQQQRDRVVEPLRRVQPYGAVAVPELEPLGLVFGLGMPPSHLHHDVPADSIGGRRDPRRLAAGLERLTHGERPPILQLARRPPAARSATPPDRRLRRCRRAASARSRVEPDTTLQGSGAEEVTDAAGVAVGRIEVLAALDEPVQFASQSV